jgi:DNA-binding PadR family transcriptional regulator
MSLKYTLLALLYQRPMHGYELGKQLHTVISAEWDVKPGQIASTLSRLKDAGLVDYSIEPTDDAPDRKVYFITDSGTQELAAWYTSPEVRDYRLGDTFYVKLVLSLLGGPVNPEQVLIKQRRELYQQLHEVTELLRKTNARTQLPWLLLLESATMHLEADLRWIEMCEARLPELKAYSPAKPEPKARGRPRRKPMPLTDSQLAEPPIEADTSINTTVNSPISPAAKD